MRDSLAELHIETYDSLADEYENRVDLLKPVSEDAIRHLTRQLKKGSKVLDIGCAVGYTVAILRDHGMKAEGIDISPEMIRYAKARNPDSTLIVGDFLTTKFQNNSYDSILAFAFIHLFPKKDVEKIFEKMIRILKPDGYMLVGSTESKISAEGFEQKEDYAKETKRFRKHWTKAELEKLIETNGLEITDSLFPTDEFGKVWMDYIVRKPKTRP
jgi:ubiquinone/menaquinone biosynthesis C-methylase UbiE